MLPLTTLPLPTTITEITMQQLMKEASQSFDNGKFKISYELYIEALFSAMKEFQQLQFSNKNQCVIQQQNDLSSVFVLAQTCLRHAQDIALNSNNSNKPVVPPKPSSLSSSTNKKQPPPLPIRPLHLNTSMIRTKSDYVKKTSECDINNYNSTYSDDDEDEDEENDMDEIVVGGNSIVKDQQHHHQQHHYHLKKKSMSSIRKRNKLKRRSSTSNISSYSTPYSHIITTNTTSSNNPLNAVKSFLSLPSSMSSHNNSTLDGDDIFLLSNGTIDPSILITVQTSYSDNSLQSSSTTNNNYLPMIPQAPLVTVYQSLQKKLDELKKTDEQFNNIQSLLNRVRNIHMSATTVPTILQFQPVLIAYQLTLIESTIFRNIPTEAILSHSPKTPHRAIVASTDFFNYLTRLIEHAILLQQDASGRAQHINHWIKVAGKCHEFKNYQTLKAVISALGTPPIQRLKRSWSFIPKKSMNVLEDLSDLMSEGSNYGKYRTRLGLSQDVVEDDDEITMRSHSNSQRKNSFSEPTVPFLGIFIHDMTYLIAALSKKKKNDHNTQWNSSNSKPSVPDSNSIEIMQQDVRVSELLKLFKNLQRSPPYSPNLSAGCIKDLNKNRKRKLSHALTRSSAIKKSPAYFSNQHDDETGGELSIEMQQCLVTQYLLTRSWVSEKTVDELSLVREPTKRSYSVTDSLAGGANALPSLSQQPPPTITSSVSLTTTARSSSGSLTSSSSNSRPLSLDDDNNNIMDEEVMERKASIGGGFWLFGRKSVDQGHLKSSSSSNDHQPFITGTLHRSPRHFSFEELNSITMAKSSNTNTLRKQQSSLSIDSTIKMQREGSQSSLASSIFRKDFWKNSNNNSTASVNSNNGGRNPLLNFNSDPSMLSSVTIQRKGSTNSLIQPSPSTSSETHHHIQHHHIIRKPIHHINSPHPLDNTTTASTTTTTTTTTTDTPQSEISDFHWDQ